MPVTPASFCLIGFIGGLSVLVGVYVVHTTVRRAVAAIRARIAPPAPQRL